jgi:hypothetical protein
VCFNYDVKIIINLIIFIAQTKVFIPPKLGVNYKIKISPAKRVLSRAKVMG